MAVLIPPTGLRELLLSNEPSTPTMIGGNQVSAFLELQGTDKGLLLPRMSTAQRNAIPYPTNGLLIYNETTHATNTFANDVWTSEGSGTVTSVAVSSSTSGLTVGGGPITDSGTLTFALSVNLQSLSDLVSTGIMVKTGGGTYSTRSIATASSSRITVSNANGVAADPTVDLATTAITPGAFTYPSSITFDAYGRATAATSGGGAPVLSVSGTAGNISSTGGQNPILNLVTTGVSTGLFRVPNVTVDSYGRLTAVDSATRILDSGFAVGNFFAGSGAGNLTYTSAEFNTGVGINALNAITTGIQNSFGGHAAGILITSGRYNSGWGEFCLSSITNNDACTALGYSAAAALSTGSGVLALGESAMSATTSAVNVIALGKSTTVTDGISNAVAIGYSTAITISNAINIGNGCKVGLNNSAPAYNLDIVSISNICATRMANGTSVPSFSTSGFNQYTYTAQTSNTNDLNLTILNIGTNKSATIEIIVNGATTTLSDFTGGNGIACVMRAAGSISLIGEEYNKIVSTTGDFSIGISGTGDVILHATGIAASTYNWTITVKYQIL